MWRPEDEALLQRLDDEVVLERLFAHHTGQNADGWLVPRAAGLVASARAAGAGQLAVTALAPAPDLVPLVRWLEAPPLAVRPPELLHHLALYHATVARALEDRAPDAAANAWCRALAAWLALGEEKTYLTTLTDAVLGPPRAARTEARTSPDGIVRELAKDLGERASSSARDLAPRGRAALLALAWMDQIAHLAGLPLSSEPVRALAREADRQRTAAIDAALALVGEALEEANARGALTTEGPGILRRAIVVWGWAGQDEAVEGWVVDRVGTIGWEIHRARDWTLLRVFVEPFRPVFESLAARIERDPSKIAFSSHCAQMFVFLYDVERDQDRRRALAERAVRICPTHRNGRLVLASTLCDDALAKLRTMTFVARRDDLAQAEALLARAEKLYPQLKDLEDAKALLARVKNAPLAL